MFIKFKCNVQMMFIYLLCNINIYGCVAIVSRALYTMYVWEILFTGNFTVYERDIYYGARENRIFWWSELQIIIQ